MSSSYGSSAIPRVYDELDEQDTRLDPALLSGSFETATSNRGGTMLMAAAIAPMPMPMPRPRPSPVGRILAANAPNRVQIRVSPPAPVRAPAGPTVTEWVVAVGAGLTAAILIGVIAALV